MEDDHLRRCIGELFIMGFEGTSLESEARSLIQDHHVGAFLLTSRNITSAEQAKQLILDLQSCALAAGYEQPLLIAIDQENGGINSVCDERISQFPSAMGIAACDSIKLVGEVAAATAHELKCLGINWIFGPILDVLSNTGSQPLGVRSFGDDPNTVAAFGEEAVRGYKEGGIAACGKHFPSYGDIDFKDGSPFSVPSVSSTIAQLHQGSFIPFSAAIRNGLEAILVGGCTMTGLGHDISHACLSEKIVTQVLRLDLGFEGIIVSECLGMEALCEDIGIAQGAVSAIVAGCDLVLVCQTFQAQLEALSGLRIGIKNDVISTDMVYAAGRRIHELKVKHTSWSQALNPSGLDGLRALSKRHRQLGLDAYKRSISLVRDYSYAISYLRTLRDTSEILLLSPLLELFPSTMTRNCSTSHSNTSEDETSASLLPSEGTFQRFGRFLSEKLHGKVTHTSYSSNGLRPSHEQHISRADVVIVITADAVLNTYQYGVTKHVNMLCRYKEQKDATRKPMIVIAVSSPYDFLHDGDIGTYICTYDFTKLSLDTVGEILTGNSSPTGTLPIAAVRRNKRQHGTDGTGKPRQTWLVEEYDSQCDRGELGTLLARMPELQGYDRLNTDGYQLRDQFIDERHFVVKNSSTRVIYGFCATYIFGSLTRASIAALMVIPDHRKKGIGSSLFTHALKYLSEDLRCLEIHIGSVLPSPLDSPALDYDPIKHGMIGECARNMGLQIKQGSCELTLILHSLPSWTFPSHISESLFATKLMFEIIQQDSSVTSEAVMCYVNSAANTQDLTKDMYRLALNAEDGSRILVSKDEPGNIIATVIIRADKSALDNLFPVLKVGQESWVGAFVLNDGLMPDQATLVTQGIVGIAAAYLKSQKRLSIWARGIDTLKANALGAIGFEKLNEQVDIFL